MNVGDKVRRKNTEYVGEVKCIQYCGCITVVFDDGVQWDYTDQELEVLT